MNSALYSLVLLAIPTNLHENRMALRELILLLLSRKDRRGKCESKSDTVAVATGDGGKLVWVVEPCRSPWQRWPPPAARNSRKSHSTYVAPAHSKPLFCMRLCSHALLITRQSDDSFVLFTYSNVNITLPPPVHSCTRRNPL